MIIIIIIILIKIMIIITTAVCPIDGSGIPFYPTNIAVGFVSKEY